MALQKKGGVTFYSNVWIDRLKSIGGDRMRVEMNGNYVELLMGDITKQQTDAIVNAANGSLLGGGGVDGAIHRVAGGGLLEECKRIRQDTLHGAYLPAGEAVVTSGYHLPAKYVIHTVGPVWKQDEDEEKLLANCYKNALKLAKERGLKSISFPSISTGVYRFPVHLAARVALREIGNFLNQNKFKEVAMVLFSEEDYDVYENTLKNRI